MKSLQSSIIKNLTKKVLIVPLVLLILIGTVLYFVIFPSTSNKPKLIHTSLSSKSFVLAQMVQDASKSANSLNSPMPINVTISDNGQIILVDQLTIGFVTQIDTSNMQIVHVYQVPYSSLGVSFSRDDKSAYVVGTNGNILKLNLTDFTTTTIRQKQLHTTADSYFLDVATSIDNHDLWISSPNNNQILEYDLNTNKITKTFNLTNAPFDIALTQDNKYLWMTEPQSDQIQELNLSNGQISNTIGFTSPVFGITLADSDKTAWVTEPFKGNVIEENLSDSSTIKILSGFNKPAGISVNPSNHDLAICLFGTNNIIFIDPKTYEQVLSYNIDPQESTSTGSVNNANPYINNPKLVKGISQNQSLFFANELDGWELDLGSNTFEAASNSGMYNANTEIIKMTTDGGKTWVNSYTGQYNQLTGLDFVNSQIGYATVDPITANTTTLKITNQVELLQTTDGGLNWTPISTTTPSAIQYINFTTPEDGFAIDSTGQVLQTTDGGHTWIPETNTPTLIGSLCQTNSDTYVANSSNVYLQQSDGSWQSIFKNNYLQETMGSIILACQDNTLVASVGFAAGAGQNDNGYVEESIDAGKTWETVITSTSGPSLSKITSNSKYFPGNNGPGIRSVYISAPEEKIGYFTVCQLVCPNGTVLFTTINVNLDNEFTGVIAGTEPLASSDTGQSTTTSLTSNLQYSFKSAFFLASGYGWVQIEVSPANNRLDQSTISFVTTNFGQTWSQL